MPDRHPTQCAACKHLRPPKGTLPVLMCDAFPGGIPLSIGVWGGDHRTTRKGDHGVTFEVKEGPEAQADLENWMFVYAPEEWQRGNQEAGREEGGDAA